MFSKFPGFSDIINTECNRIMQSLLNTITFWYCINRAFRLVGTVCQSGRLYSMCFGSKQNIGRDHLKDEIERTRKLMINIAINKGLAANETIEISRKLDRLLNQYLKDGNRNQF